MTYKMSGFLRYFMWPSIECFYTYSMDLPSKLYIYVYNIYVICMYIICNIYVFMYILYIYTYYVVVYNIYVVITIYDAKF